MRILLTRPEADAQRTAERLGALGHEPILSPLLDIAATRTRLPEGEFDAVLATSSHTFDDLHRDTARLKPLPLYCVGERTAAAARTQGFASIAAVAPDAAALSGAIAGMQDRPRRFLYLAGRERRPEIERSLAAQGHSVTPCIVYEARAKEQAPSTMVDALRAGAVDAVLHFSPRSAALYLALAEKAQIRDEALAPAQIAISERAAQCLRGAHDLRVAPHPDLEGLISCL